jgi:hypothetical protein
MAWLLLLAAFAGAPARLTAQTVAVSGRVQPAPTGKLTIEVKGGRGKGEIGRDGSFRFDAKGQAKERVAVSISDEKGNVLAEEDRILGAEWEMQIGAAEPAKTDSAIVWAIVWSLGFSVLAGFIELQQRSNAELRSCWVRAAGLYIALLCVFNTLGAAVAAGLLRDKSPGGPTFAPLFYALFGVFAFEGVLSNTNITIFEKGVLAFQEWIGKARDPAVTAVKKNQAQKDNDRTTSLANRLMNVQDDRFYAYILEAFGKEAGEKLLDESKAYADKYHADAKFYVALAFGRIKPDQADSAARQSKV